MTALPLDTPMLRDTFRSIRSEAMHFLGYGKEKAFNKMVEAELKAKEMEPRPTNWVAAAETVLHDLALMDNEGAFPDAIDFFMEG